MKRKKRGRDLQGNRARQETPPTSSTSISLESLFWIFLRIAGTSFGGFMAMIAVVENVIVERRRLLSHRDMLDGISLASLLPGPVAINLVAYVGYRLRGGAGALVSTIAAVTPAFVVMVLLSIAYFEWGRIPAVSKVFLGFIPAVTAIIAVAAWDIGRKSVRSWHEGIIATAAAAALLGFRGFFVSAGIIVVAGIVGLLWLRDGNRPEPPTTRAEAAKLHDGASLFLVLSAATPLATLFAFEPGLLLKIFFTFGGMSLMLFGGAYVFVPLIQEIIVNGLGWVTMQEFVDAVAFGQIMPGPVLISAAFIGMKVAGLAGAVVATIGIFLPAALLTVACSRVLERIKGSATVKAVLRGIRPAIVGMIFAAAIVVGKTAAPVWISGVIFVTALIVLLRFRLEAIWIIPPAGALGFLLY